MTTATFQLEDRQTRLRRLGAAAPRDADVLVVGGGITGAGVALDLALRGLGVVLLERGDWASGTSSASSRLIHGGLRYLEQFEVGLVRVEKSGRERLYRLDAAQLDRVLGAWQRWFDGTPPAGRLPPAEDER